MRNAEFDIEQERRRILRETIAIIVSVVALVIGAFAAGYFIR